MRQIDQKYDWKYDTQDSLNLTLEVIQEAINNKLEQKPDKGSPYEKQWGREMAVLRRWAVETHHRFIALNMRTKPYPRSR